METRPTVVDAMRCRVWKLDLQVVDTMRCRVWKLDLQVVDAAVRKVVSEVDIAAWLVK